MDEEPRFMLVDTRRARKDAQRLFAAVSERLAALLPGADIRHIGATAVPGCLTKGDLDIVVRVGAEDFATADSVVAAAFSRNGSSVRTQAFSAFEDASSHPHLGIQLVAVDSPFDSFHLFAEALQRSPSLVEEYNALKRLHEGADMARYREAKGRFVERVLANAG